MDIKQLHYFLVCAQCGSFSEAADHLYTTQPNVSKVIKALEEELNVKLFLRKSKGIELTEEAVQIYRYAQKAYENLQNLKNLGECEEKN